MRRRLDAIDAWLNPLLVKEVFQGFRSKLVFVNLLLLLLIPLSVLAMVLSAPGSAESGEVLLITLAVGVGAVSLSIVPAGVGNSLLGDIRSRTIELLLLTRLTPWQMASGRFQAGLVNLIVVTALLAPFAVAAVLLGGTGLVEAAAILGALVALGVFLCAFALMLVAPAALQPKLAEAGRGAAALVVVFPLVALGLASAFFGSGAPTTPSAGQLGWWVLVMGGGTLVCLRIAADAMTPIGLRHHAWSKLAMALLVALLTMPLWTGLGYVSDSMRLSALAVFAPFAIVWTLSAIPEASHVRVPWLLRNGYRSALAYAAIVFVGITFVPCSPSERLIPLLAFGNFLLLSGPSRLVVSVLPKRARTPGARAGAFLTLVLAQLAATIAAQAMVTQPAQHGLSVFVPLVFTYSGVDALSHGAWWVLPGLIGLVCAMLVGRFGSKPRAE
jgi:hypothetical protein